MFVVMLAYVKPLAEVDALMNAHVAFLEVQFRAGKFLAAGRRDPRVGGVILARGFKRAELEALLRQDPFVAQGVATFDVVEFRTSLHHPDFSKWADPGTRPVRPT